MTVGLRYTLEMPDETMDPPGFPQALRRWGVPVAGASLAVTTVVLLPIRQHTSLTSIALLYLLPVVATAAVGSVWLALVAAAAAAGLVNFFFVPPFHTLRIESQDNLIALVVYIVVACAVAVALDVAARHRAIAAHKTREVTRLAGAAARAQELAEIDRLRAALLSAVGHDLRTPLAGIKAAVSSLRQPDITWSAVDEAELLATVEESTDRLVALVENLLSLSRLQAGALSVTPRPVSLDGVVGQTLLSSGVDAAAVEVDVPDDLPLVLADPGLLERVLANLIANARTASPPGRPVLVCGRAGAGHLTVRVIDHGPGIPASERERVFAPFQRHGDRATAGLGLGLAIAKGFTEAMNGTIAPSQTPGGGLTMTITLPAAS